MATALKWTGAFLFIRMIEGGGVLIAAAIVELLKGEAAVDAAKAGIFLVLAAYVLYPHMLLSLGLFILASLVPHRYISASVAASPGIALFAIAATSDPVTVEFTALPMISGVFAAGLAAFSQYSRYSFYSIARKHSEKNG